MLQEERNWLFKVAYSLDNRARIADKAGNRFVVFTDSDCEKLAEEIRQLAVRDGNRLTDGDTKDNRRSSTRTPRG